VHELVLRGTEFDSCLQKYRRKRHMKCKTCDRYNYWATVRRWWSERTFQTSLKRANDSFVLDNCQHCEIQ